MSYVTSHDPDRQPAGVRRPTLWQLERSEKAVKYATEILTVGMKCLHKAPIEWVFDGTLYNQKEE